MARLALMLCFGVSALHALKANGEESIPAVYQRNRATQSFNSGYGGFDRRGSYGGYGYGVPYAYPWFAPQFFAGTWYQRPYPYHFDYYRWRYSLPPVEMVAPDCPCAEIPSGEPTY